MNCERTVILVVKQKYYNTPSDGFWGLGDILRGIANVYELCLEKRWNFYIDITQHPIGNFLKPLKNITPPSHIGSINYDNVPFVYELNEYLDNNKHNNVLIFFSNTCMRYNNDKKYSQSVKIFLNSIFVPTPTFQEHIDKTLLNLPQPNFNVIHFRVGDKDIVENLTNHLDSLYSTFESLYYLYSDSNSIVLSDSLELRKRLQQDCSANTLLNPIGHIGYHSDLVQIKNSLLEFFILAYAQKIYGYTVYKGTFNVSGFIRIVGEIYDVPVTPMLSSYSA